jgi:hypothetical protein
MTPLPRMTTRMLIPRFNDALQKAAGLEDSAMIWANK